MPALRKYRKALIELANHLLMRTVRIQGCEKHMVERNSSPQPETVTELSKIPAIGTSRWSSLVAFHGYQAVPSRREIFSSRLRMTEQDKQIVDEALHECKFIGPIGNRNEDSEEATRHLKAKSSTICVERHFWTTERLEVWSGSY